MIAGATQVIPEMLLYQYKLIPNNKQLHIEKHAVYRQQEAVEPVEITAVTGK